MNFIVLLLRPQCVACKQRRYYQHREAEPLEYSGNKIGPGGIDHNQLSLTARRLHILNKPAV